MKRIFIPTDSYTDWQRLLAKPSLHWKPGFSAMTLAQSWETAGSNGFPPEVEKVLLSSGNPGLTEIELLLATPEYQVDLPPAGGKPSQVDLFVLARNRKGLVTVAVEGKVDEPFGPTIGDRLRDATPGIIERLDFLKNYLQIQQPIPSHIRYQLVHRTASALLLAEKFTARTAVMLVHSFSPTNKGFDDFLVFGKLFDVKLKLDILAFAGDISGISLFFGWCRGEQRFRGRL